MRSPSLVRRQPDHFTPRPSAEASVTGNSVGVAAARLEGWGWCAVAASAAGVCGALIGMDDQRSAVSGVEITLAGRLPDTANARRGLKALLSLLNGNAGGPVTLDMAGTEFQKEVWRALTEIGWGETITYSGLATRMGRTGATARAVGAAVGANPAPVLVPCHRVLPAAGGIGGYRLGSPLKQKLLTIERGAPPG